MNPRDDDQSARLLSTVVVEDDSGRGFKSTWAKVEMVGVGRPITIECIVYRCIQCIVPSYIII